VIPILVICLIFFIVIGVPISFAITLSGFFAVVLTGSFPLYMVAQRFISGINSFSLMAVPLFIVAGSIMSNGGISRRIVDFCSALLSWLRGGLAIVCVAANMIFAGISGSGTAAISAIGGLTAPAMEEKGYSKGFVGALIGAAGSLGPVIPPSCDMIVFASITGMSVAKMFVGGIVPGFTIGIIFMIISSLYAKKHDIDYGGKFNGHKVWASFKEAIWALIMPLIVLGGVIFGVFTATEAGAVACAYGVLVGKFVYKELKWKDFFPVFKTATEVTAQVMMILASSTVFGYIFTVENVGVHLRGWLTNTTDSTLVIMLMTAGLMLLIGCFMESLAAMPVVLPIVFPLLQSMGANMNQFGVMFCLCTIMGGLTPPVGCYLFIASSIAKEKVTKVIPWMMVMIAVCVSVMLLTAFWEPFATFLPNLLVK